MATSLIDLNDVLKIFLMCSAARSTLELGGRLQRLAKLQSIGTHSRLIVSPCYKRVECK